MPPTTHTPLTSCHILGTKKKSLDTFNGVKYRQTHCTNVSFQSGQTDATTLMPEMCTYLTNPTTSTEGLIAIVFALSRVRIVSALFSGCWWLIMVVSRCDLTVRGTPLFTSCITTGNRKSSIVMWTRSPTRLFLTDQVQYMRDNPPASVSSALLVHGLIGYEMVKMILVPDKIVRSKIIQSERWPRQENCS